jgi:hypothetical protein
MRGYPELSEHELRATLCWIAAEHQPDRAAILNRVVRYRADAPVTERRPAGRTLRLAGSALAVATILGAGGAARWALTDGPEPGVVPVAPPTATPSLAAPSPPEPLRADGSINPNSDDTEGRSDITLKVREPLRALRVTVRVAPTAGLTDRGGTHDVADAKVNTSVVREQDTLVYHFDLAEGATLGPGTYVFTARYTYDNEGGRDAGDDTYAVTATTVGRAVPLAVDGDFA